MAALFTFEATTIGMEWLIPFVFVLRQTFSQLLVTLANVAATGAKLVSTLERLLACLIINQQISGIANFLANTISLSIYVSIIVLVFVNQTLVALAEAFACAVNTVEWFSKSTLSNVVATLG